MPYNTFPINQSERLTHETDSYSETGIRRRETAFHPVSISLRSWSRLLIQSVILYLTASVAGKRLILLALITLRLSLY